MDNNIKEIITNEINENDICLFMKGTPDAPQCGFSAQVVHILNQTGVEFETRDVLQDELLRQGIKDFTNWPTIPQLYIKGEFIGGCDIILDMHKSGELASVFDTKGITHD